MITAKRLKALLEHVPDDAMVWAYQGEDSGFAAQLGTELHSRKGWWIRATEDDEEDIYVEGFGVELDNKEKAVCKDCKHEYLCYTDRRTAPVFMCPECGSDKVVKIER